jgi:hypothetical protein
MAEVIARRQGLAVMFHEGAPGRLLELATLEKLLGEVKVLLANECLP